MIWEVAETNSVHNKINRNNDSMTQNTNLVLDLTSYTADECFCCQELDALNPKFDEAIIECITGHSKFRTVCLDTDVLHTALVAIHNACCNPLPDPIENRLVFWQFSG